MKSGLSSGSYSFKVTATIMVGGQPITQEAVALLTIVGGRETSISGRVLSSEDEPIPGATISLDGQTATTDAAGSFVLMGVKSGERRPLMIDGRTANAPHRTYPVRAGRCDR
jgi:hypothetical protein